MAQRCMAIDGDIAATLLEPAGGEKQETQPEAEVRGGLDSPHRRPATERLVHRSPGPRALASRAALKMSTILGLQLLDRAYSNAETPAPSFASISAP